MPYFPSSSPGLRFLDACAADQGAVASWSWGARRFSFCVEAAFPVPQRLMMISAGFAHVGSTNHAGGVAPNASSIGDKNQFKRPTCPLRIQSHNIEDATTGTIDGR